MCDSYLHLDMVPEGSGFKMDGYWVWCGSVIEEPGNGFHMYAARWPKNYPMFEGYIYLSEIVRAWSPNVSGPYIFAEKILPSGNSSHWYGRMAHNPSVLKYGNKYLLYFIGSTYDYELPPPDRIQEEKQQQCDIYNNIRIGLAVSDSPAGPWQIFENPILKPRPDRWDDHIVTNPAPCILPDGRIFLYYRSNTPEGLRIGLAVSEEPEGPYKRVQDDPVLEGFNVEDPFVWHDGKQFHMLAKDMDGSISGEIFAGACFVSDDGINWRTSSIKKGYSRTLKFHNGEIKKLGCLERPQLLFDSTGQPGCLFCAAADGPGGFYEAHNTWNIAIPVTGTQIED